MITRAYTACAVYYGVERIERVSKAALADLSQLHRGWVEEEGNGYDYYFAFYQKQQPYYTQSNNHNSQFYRSCR